MSKLFQTESADWSELDRKEIVVTWAVIYVLDMFENEKFYESIPLRHFIPKLTIM